MLRSLLRFFSFLALFGALAGGLYGSYRLLRDVDVSIPAFLRPAPGKRLLISMDGFRFAQTEGGRVAWRIKASRTDLFENREARLREVELQFLEPKGRKVVLVGETAVMDTVKGNAAIRRGAQEVKIITSDGYLMTTNSLFWRAGDRLITTPDPFKVIGKEIYLEGKGFSAAVDMRKMRVESDVKAVLQE